MFYYEIARETVANRNQVILTSLLNHEVEQANEKRHELYSSLYYYDDDIIDHLKMRKTIKGFKGKYYLQNIIFDVDRGEKSLAVTRAVVKDFCDFLMNEHKLEAKDIQPYFSGRGFHIQIPDIFLIPASNQLPQILKTTLMKHFDHNIDNIYDASRILRVTNTVNKKTNLFKIPLTLDELYDDKFDIEQTAIAPRILEIEIPEDKTDYSFMKPLISSPELDPEMVAKTAEVIQVVPCIQEIYHTAKTGERHKAILCIASSWRRHGVPQQAVVDALVARFKPMAAYEIKHAVDSVFTAGYRYGCDHPMMAAKCDARCIYFKKKDYNLQVASAEEMGVKYKEFIATDFTDIAFDLQPLMPNMKSPYMIYPGELVLFEGDTGLGKTAIVQNICVWLKHMRVLFLSLEVHQNLIFRRFLQIAHKLTKQEVVKAYQEKDQKLFEAIKHIQVTTTAPTLPAIYRAIVEIKPHLIVIDTTEGIVVSDARDDIQRGTLLGTRLKQMAQQTDTIILAVHHISKLASNSPILTVHSGKGSSTWEQQADKVIGIEGSRNQPHRKITSLKARDEATFSIHNFLDFSTFSLTDTLPKESKE